MNYRVIVCASAAYAVLLSADAARAADATIIAVYQNCRPVTSTVVVDPNAMAAPEAQVAVAEAEAIAARGEFETTLPAMVKALERRGIRETEVRRQGFRGCEPLSSGKYVEALGSYCNGLLESAEIRVDGNLFLRRSNPQSSLETFVDRAVVQLRKAGIWDRPRVSVSNSPECAETEPGQEPPGPAGEQKTSA